MAHMPVEIIDIGDVPVPALNQAITVANSLQSEFYFVRLSEADAAEFRMYSFTEIFAPDLLSRMEDLRSSRRGYHPFLIAFIDAVLNGEKYHNLFASNRPEKGLGIVTFANVAELILPADKLAAYVLYYLAHQTLGFIAPEHKNHDDSRGCVFDRKIEKRDLLKSMRARALCNACRSSLLSVRMLSPGQLSAADKLYNASGAMLQQIPDDATVRRRPRMFIGSSTEGLSIANEIQRLLEHEFEVDVWNQSTTFGLGNSTLESLEEAVLKYDFAVFVFRPDDELQTRGATKPVARDNVLFELGLFIGKLSRRRAFIVQPRGESVALPSDLLGIATATYDAQRQNLAAALGPACQSIRDAVAAALHRI
jgi:predicted nucleotide-binding protein